MTLPVNDGSDPPGHNGHKLGTITNTNKSPTAAFFARIVIAGIIILGRCSWDTAAHAPAHSRASNCATLPAFHSRGRPFPNCPAARPVRRHSHQ